MIFLDTSILIGGVFAAPHGSADARQILARAKSLATAWHCCLEFYSVLTRLPEEQRLRPEEVLLLLEEYVLDRMRVLQLPDSHRKPFLRRSAMEDIRGGRLYDAHVAEIAYAHRAEIVVTENAKDFMPLLRSGIPVMRASEFVKKIR